MSTSVRFEYKGAVRGVVLFGGMQIDELNSILKSVFSINAASIVGFFGEVNNNIYSVEFHIDVINFLSEITSIYIIGSNHHNALRIIYYFYIYLFI